MSIHSILTMILVSIGYIVYLFLIRSFFVGTSSHRLEKSFRENEIKEKYE